MIQESETEGRRFVFLGEEDRIVLTLWPFYFYALLFQTAHMGNKAIDLRL